MEETIHRYLEMSDAELYSELAATIEGGYAATPDPEEREVIGARYFASILPRIRDIVCGSQVARSFVESNDHFAIASAVAVLIASSFQLPSTVATLSVLVARMSLRELCKEDDT